jgi:hypothetical protein
MDEFLNAVEAALQARNWYAALVVALVLPDIAGWVEDPTLGSGDRFSNWFDRYVGKRYESSGSEILPPHKFLSGDDCYALRCSLLHEGRDDIAHQRARASLERFQFIVPRGGIIHCNQVNKKLQLQVDIFCRDICQGARDWLASIPESDKVRRSRLSELLNIQIESPILI